MDKTISHYDETPTNNLNSFNQVNKTASIGRHHGKRMTSVEMNEIFARETSTSSTVNTELSASHQQKPIIMDIPRGHRSSEGNQTKNQDNPHVTRVAIGTGDKHNVAVYDEFSRTVVDVANLVSSGDESSSKEFDSDGKNMYIFPSKVQTRSAQKLRSSSIESSDSSGKSANISQIITEAVAEPTPDYPTLEQRESAEVVKISTTSSPYAIVSNNVVQQSSDVESSFRPGIDARMSKDPEIVHSKSRPTSSSSGHSGTSGQPLDEQDRKTGTAFAITATAIAANHQSMSHQYLEPTPDYLREPLKSEQTENPFPKPTVPEDKPLSPIPDNNKEDKSLFEFNNAIKMAALAREKRSNEQPVEVQVNDLRQSKSSAPPPPKMPPPSENVWSRPIKHVRAQQSLPEPVKKQLQEDRKREQGQNDLMAAIAKRRTLVEQSNMGFVADSIEKQVQQNKIVRNKVPVVSKTVTESSPKAESKTAEPLEKESPPKKDTKTEDPVVESETEGKSDEPVDFAALAEKKRQDWLLKRVASNPGTLERPVKKGEASLSPQVTAEPSQLEAIPVAGAPPPPPVVTNGVIKPKEMPKPKNVKRVQVTADSNMQSASGMADFASMVAQRAMSWQKSQIEEKSSGNTIFSSVGSPKSPTSPKPTQSDLKPVQPGKSIEIQGATTTYSHTERPLRSPTVENNSSSVLARSKTLEGRAGSKPGQAGNKIVYKAKPTATGKLASGMNVYSSREKVINGGENTNKQAYLTLVKDEDIPIVPPPPMFEAGTYPPSRADDNVSVVSDVSSLSSLSQDSPKSAGRTGTYNIAPPPPGFDDGDFVPPPTEFSGESGQPNLKSIKRADGNHSMSFPAVTNSEAFQWKPIDSWSKDDVGHWLDSVSMSQYKTLFNRKGIAGRDLVKLSRKEFSSMGITHVGQRMELEKAIKSAAAR